MASLSSGLRDCHQGEASLEAEAREMSRLAVKAANMSCRTTVAAERSRRAAEASRMTRRTVDVADWSGRATNAEEMSSLATVAWENASRAGEDSYRRMHVMVHSQMDQISVWARLQDEATGVIWQLGEGKSSGVSATC